MVRMSKKSTSSLIEKIKKSQVFFKKNQVNDFFSTKFIDTNSEVKRDLTVLVTL